MSALFVVLAGCLAVCGAALLWRRLGRAETRQPVVLDLAREELVADAPASMPLPWEPDDGSLPLVARRMGRTPRSNDVAPVSVNVASGARAASPYERLREQRDVLAAQASAAFAEVHLLRTASLRRASQAEQNAELATSARARADRMVRDQRRATEAGRRRPVDAPDARDAYGDVHVFRTEALRRAQEAAHGAQAVARTRDRAKRLLAEQRRIESEMAHLLRNSQP